ncbi:MAG: hypothetical protein HUU35_02590 [Armatimonadetes bacterium]|nr:hypothetical protein [Armatimonadota bacterium]
MQAGFARRDITPPLGSAMAGWCTRDLARGCDHVLDPLYVRLLALEHAGERALLVAFDLLFLGRELSDRLKGALGSRFDLAPRQILLNASHNHAGPADGGYGFAVFDRPDPLDLDAIVEATLAAAEEAMGALQEVTITAGVGRSQVPVCRRRADAAGCFHNAPNLAGFVYDKLPVCRLESRAGETVALLFSIASHPTIVYGHGISADYPGAAAGAVDAWLGHPAAIFLQGCGADSKPRQQISGEDWITADQALAVLAGETLAAEVIDVCGRLRPVEPALRTALTEVDWPLQPALNREEYAAQLTGNRNDLKQRSLALQVERLDRGQTLTDSAPLLVQGIQLGEGLRLVAIEGEPCAPFAHQAEGFFGAGVTFPLGYSNGTGLYLVTTQQLAEGGYEPESYWEYLFPAPPRAGFEHPLAEALVKLSEAGIA